MPDCWNVKILHGLETKVTFLSLGNFEVKEKYTDAQT